MGTTSVFLGIMAVSAYALLWIAFPILLTVWMRRRREQATQRQIALTDAIHWQLGAVVSPVVEHPLWRPWRVRIAAPLGEPALVGRVLAVTRAVLSAYEPGDSSRYRIVLTPMQDLTDEGRGDHDHKSAERWPGKSSVATA